MTQSGEGQLIRTIKSELGGVRASFKQVAALIEATDDEQTRRKLQDELRALRESYTKIKLELEQERQQKREFDVASESSLEASWRVLKDQLRDIVDRLAPPG